MVEPIMKQLKWTVEYCLAWTQRHAGLISEVAAKHRAAVLIWSVIATLVDHNTKVTLGSASLAGLGITVEPPQTLPVGLLVALMLVYRIIALWFTALSDTGTDSKKASYIACHKHDPDSLTPGGPAYSPSEVAAEETENIMYSWSLRRVIWELIFPTFVGFGALIWNLF